MVTCGALIFALVFLVAAVAAQTAAASQVISTSTVTGLKLGVNSKGEALVSYTSGGKAVEVLAWGAVNALPPTQGKKQVDLHLDYSGGYTLAKGDIPKATEKLRDDQAPRKAQAAAAAQGKKYSPDVSKWSAEIQKDYAAITKLHDQSKNYDKTFTCPKYTGPALAWSVAACTAPDGSYWAVQEWQRQLPDYGVTPTAGRRAWRSTSPTGRAPCRS